MGIESLLNLGADHALGTDQQETDATPSLDALIASRDIMCGSTPVARDKPMPALTEAIGAMLIIGRCTATYQGAYWQVRNKKTGNATNVSLRNNECEWQECLAKIGDQAYGQ